MNDFRISNPASFIVFIASGYFLTQSPTVKKVACASLLDRQLTISEISFAPPSTVKS